MAISPVSSERSTRSSESVSSVGGRQFVGSLEKEFGEGAIKATKQWLKSSQSEGMVAFRARMSDAVRNDSPLDGADQLYLKHVVQLVVANNPSERIAQEFSTKNR